MNSKKHKSKQNLIKMNTASRTVNNGFILTNNEVMQTAKAVIFNSQSDYHYSWLSIRLLDHTLSYNEYTGPKMIPNSTLQVLYKLLIQYAKHYHVEIMSRFKFVFRFMLNSTRCNNKLSDRL